MEGTNMMGIVRQNRIKQNLSAKQPVFDCRISILDPELVEIAGMAGLDCLFIDGEHSNFNWDDALACVLAAELYGMTPVLRPTELPGYREYMVQRALNIGFQGMMLTGVSTPEDARALLDVMKFPPQGKRGVGEGRVHERAGDRIQVGPEVLQELNDEIFTCILIESVEGITKIDEICAVDGIDAVGLGHRDFALDAKLPTFSMDQEEMQAALQAIRAAAERHGKAWYGAAGSADELKRQVADGALLFSAGREIRAWQRMCNEFRAIVSDAGF